MRLNTKNTNRLNCRTPKSVTKLHQKHTKHRSTGLPATKNHKTTENTTRQGSRSPKNIRNAKNTNRPGCRSPNNKNTDRLGCRLPRNTRNTNTADGLRCLLPENWKDTTKTLIGLPAVYQKTPKTWRRQKTLPKFQVDRLHCFDLALFG